MPTSAGTFPPRPVLRERAGVRARYKGLKQKRLEASVYLNPLPTLRLELSDCPHPNPLPAYRARGQETDPLETPHCRPRDELGDQLIP
jgi:hypothetical protein